MGNNIPVVPLILLQSYNRAAAKQNLINNS